MHSQEFYVSYFATGIFANLFSDGTKDFSNMEIDLKTFLSEMVCDYQFNEKIRLDIIIS
jgi:hypothetical protein